jgi:lysophospholipase L1-like esterase
MTKTINCCGLAGCVSAMGIVTQAREPAVTPAVGDVRLRIVAFGDSTTAPRGSLAIYSGLIEKELPAKNLSAVVINAGEPGNTTQMARRRFKADVIDHKPDLVIIQFGINDAAEDVWKTPPAQSPRVALADYRANLEFFVDTLRSARIKVLLMTPNPMRWTARLRELYGKPPYLAEDPDGFNVLLKPYAEMVRQLARNKQVECLDIYAQWESYGLRNGQSVDALLLDGMHPNTKGHRLNADLLLDKLSIMLKM